MSSFLKKMDKINTYLSKNYGLLVVIQMTCILIVLCEAGVHRSDEEHPESSNVHSMETTSQYTSAVEETFEVTTTKEPEIQPTDPNIEYAYRVDVSDADIALMARVVMSEASTQSYDCKVAVAETIINRLLSDKFPDSITEIVHQKSQYSTQNNGTVTDECYTAVVEALTNQRHPDNMYYFRGEDYHSWATDYKKIDNIFFSTEKRTS